MLLNDSFHNFSEPQSRTLKYKFKSLAGIIFGIRTPVEEKVILIEIINNKCKENGLMDFTFYQAYYDKKQHKVVYDELNLLKYRMCRGHMN